MLTCCHVNQIYSWWTTVDLNHCFENHLKGITLHTTSVITQWYREQNWKLNDLLILTTRKPLINNTDGLKIGEYREWTYNKSNISETLCKWIVCYKERPLPQTYENPLYNFLVQLAHTNFYPNLISNGWFVWLCACVWGGAPIFPGKDISLNSRSESKYMEVKTFINILLSLLVYVFWFVSCKFTISKNIIKLLSYCLILV